MGKGLALNITAVDRATRTINTINRRVREMNAPIRNMQHSMSQFSRAAGLGAMKGKLERIGHTARRVSGEFARIAAPLTAIAGGGSLAGLYALTEGWARFGMHLSQTGQILGVNTQRLYNFQNAARLVGVSGQAAMQTFQGFANTLQDARFGRNQQAMGLLLGLGIHLKNTKSGSIDAMSALGDVADRIHAFQRAGRFGAARTLASQLGLTSLLPLLMQGRRALAAYEAQAQKLSGVMNWKTAAAGALQWNALHVAMEGVRNTIGSALLPVITPLVRQFGSWIQANRSLIATDLSNFLRGLGRAFRGLTLKAVLDDMLGLVRGMMRLTTEVVRVVRDLGGFQRVLEGMAAAWAVRRVIKYGLALRSVVRWLREANKLRQAAGLPRAAGPAAEGGGATAAEGVAAGTTGAGLLAATGVGLIGGAAVYGGAKFWENRQLAKLHDRMKVAPIASAVMRYFERMGWTRNQAAGIAANIQAESGFNPRAVGDDGAARGIGQWHPARQAQFDAWARRNRLPGLDHAGLMEQLRYYNYELRHSLAGRKLAETQGAYAAGGVVSRYDERPADAAGQAAARGALAMEIAGPPPPLQVNVQTTVHRDGTSSTRVRTPQGVKVVHTSPIYGVG